MSLERVELALSFEGDGCLLCSIVQRASRRYLWHTLHEYVLDGGLHAQLRRSLGFCRRHAWALQRMEQQDWQDGLGTATLYENLTRAVAQAVLTAAAELETAPSRRLRWPMTNSAPPAVPAALQPSGECPVCRSVRRTEAYMIGVLVRLLEEDERLREQYQTSFGLCLPHLVAALAACENHKTQRFLAEVQAGKLAHLADELADYERKHAVDHQHELKGREQTSWIRVIEQFVGKSE